MKINILAIFLLLLSVNFLAQDNKGSYKRIENFEPDKTFLNAICGGFDSLYSNLDYGTRNERLAFKEALKSTKKTIQTLATDKYLMKHDLISDYLQGVANRIQLNNPELIKNKVQLFVYRTSVPNAANYGNGVIFFNLDLLSKLNKEEYVAFIICHEIAHEIRKHVLEDIRLSHHLLNDPATKEKFDKLKRQEFNSLSSYEAYITDYIHKKNSKSRINEIQADSIGMVLYHKAGYQNKYAYKAMQLLDSVDTERHTKKIDFEALFSGTDFKFDKSLLKVDDGTEDIGGNYKEKVLPDSLKSHPDCKIRLERMKSLKTGDNAETSEPHVYNDISLLANYEMLEVYKKEPNYSLGLYTTLQMRKLYPEDLYLKASTVDFLYHCYLARERHYFSYVSDLPDKKHCESYNEFLVFLSNLNAGSFKDLMNQYFKKDFGNQINDAYVAYVFVLIKSVEKPKDEIIKTIKDYENNFGKNDYLKQLKIKFDFKN